MTGLLLLKVPVNAAHGVHGVHGVYACDSSTQEAEAGLPQSYLKKNFLKKGPCMIQDRPGAAPDETERARCHLSPRVGSCTVTLEGQPTN